MSQKDIDENFQVYDNDDAYLFGDLLENNYNGFSQDKNNTNDNLNINNNTNKSSNKEILNNFDSNIINEQPNEKENIYNKNMNNVNNKNINIQNITFNKKYSLNDIGSDIDNENNSFKNSQKMKENNEIIQTNKISNNNIEIENEDSNESNIPLVTLNFLSICQCCKEPFNSKDCIPYLFRCGHFFCKKCIMENFIDEQGIKCPNDGLVAKSISELKILNNFITDKNMTQRTSNAVEMYCDYHKGQRLTHYVEETKELICIYCAFEKFKQNPNWKIKEINDKFKEIEHEIDIIMDESQHNITLIKNILVEIKKNKEIEEKKVNEIFNKLSEVIKSKKEENLNRINTLFTENAKKLSQKLEVFSSKLDKSEEIKEKISLYNERKEQNQLSFILNEYNKLLLKVNDIHYYKLVLQKYKFVYEEEPVLIRLINKFGDFKITPNNCIFMGNKKNTPITNNSTVMNHNNNFKNNLNQNQPNSKLNLNQSQSHMNINIFTNINHDKPSTINEPGNIIKKKLKANKSYSNINHYQKHSKKVSNISNSQYNSFYKQKITENNFNENDSSSYINYKNKILTKTNQKNKKFNNTLDFDISLNKKKNSNNSTTSIKINTPINLIKKNRFNTGTYSGNKYDILNTTPNNNEQSFNKINMKISGNKNMANRLKNNN